MTARGDDKVADVKEHFEKNPQSSLRRCSKEVGISITTRWRIVRKILPLSFFKGSGFVRRSQEAKENLLSMVIGQSGTK